MQQQDVATQAAGMYVSLTALLEATQVCLKLKTPHSGTIISEPLLTHYDIMCSYYIEIHHNSLLHVLCPILQVTAMKHQTMQEYPV